MGRGPRLEMRRKPLLSRAQYTYNLLQTDEHLQVNVSWNDAIAFCTKLG